MLIPEGASPAAIDSLAFLLTISIGHESFPARSAGGMDPVLLVDPVMLLEMAVGAEEHEPLGMSLDFLQRSITSPVIPHVFLAAVSMVKLQGTHATVIAASLAFAAELVYQSLLHRAFLFPASLHFFFLRSSAFR
jgi:hypothetical protein